MTDSPRDRSCEERIAEHLEGRLEDFRALSAGERSDRDSLSPQMIATLDVLGVDTENDTEPMRESALERVYEYPLGISVQTVVRVELSTGGPGDWLEVELEREPHYWDIQGIVYHFNDWFDHAERRLSGEELEAAERFCELLGITEPGVVVPLEQ